MNSAGRITFSGFGAALSALPEERRPGTVLVTIVTDGHENASHAYTANDVKRIIQTQRDAYDWDVSFLGANQDAVLEARRIRADPAVRPECTNAPGLRVSRAVPER
ncbi:MAG: hypothetical protein QM607_10320 [Microbacterium sp.]